MVEQTVNGRVEGYDLEAPSKDYAISSLSRFIDRNEAKHLWSNVCRSCHFPDTTRDLEELQIIFEHIAQKPGPIGVVGKSLVVRVMSYKTLSLKKNG